MKWLVIVGVIALIGVGVLFVGGPSPAIIVAPETVFHWGPIDVTNTMFTSWFVVAGLIILAFFVGRNLSVVPSGFSGAVEAAVEAFFDIVVQVAGEENGRRFFPLVATIFFFVLVSNYARSTTSSGCLSRASATSRPCSSSARSPASTWRSFR
jgi:F-type H+-transporting ATPase subunit a